MVTPGTQRRATLDTGPALGLGGLVTPKRTSHLASPLIRYLGSLGKGDASISQTRLDLRLWRMTKFATSQSCQGLGESQWMFHDFSSSW